MIEQSETPTKKTKANTKRKKVDPLKSIRPKSYTMPNTKLSNKITKENHLENLKLEVIVGSGKSKNEITTKVMLNYENENVHLISRVEFTPYDREVYDGVTTLYEAGNIVVNPAMVYRAMNGLTETEQVSEKAVDEVRKSLDKSSFIKISIDYTDEAKLYNREIDKTTYVGYLLACEKIIVESGGTELEAYKLLRCPILYEYAQISGQIITVPINLLNTRDTVNSTEDVIIIRGFLLRQIEWMKHPKSNRSTNITYQSVYEELEILRADLDERAYENKTGKIRKHIKAILESWKTQKYLKNFEEYKDGKQFKGVKIHL